MAASSRPNKHEEEIQFENMPNFRRIKGTSVFRSSCPDNLTIPEIAGLKDLGIKSIIDFRSPGSFEGSVCAVKKVDEYYRYVLPSWQNAGSV